MPATYRVGDSVPLTYFVRDAAGTLTNATVALVVNRPDGTTAPVSPANTGTGTYLAAFAPDMAGLWSYRYTASGAVTDAEDGLVYVEPLVTATWYVTVPELRLAVGDPPDRPTADQGQLEQACRAASAAVNRYTNRRFWRDPIVRTRRFRPDNDCLAWLRTDISGSSGLVVETDDTGAGSWTTWALGTDYDPEPLDADQLGEPFCFTALRAVGAKRFPVRGGRTRASLRVTARYGWSEVPPDVRMAAQIIGQRLYRRKDTPFGSEGFADFGAMRIVRSDPDIQALLDPLKRLGMG